MGADEAIGERVKQTSETIITFFRHQPRHGLRLRVGGSRLRVIPTAVAALTILLPAAALPDAVLPTSALAAPAARAGRYQPLTPWRKPQLNLPKPPTLDYRRLALSSLHTIQAHWSRGHWYCEYLHCSGAYPLATIWGAVGIFEAADGLQLADPSGANRHRVEAIARESQRYWDPGVGGYAPYPGDRSAGTQVWFDDNGWLGLAFYNAFLATHQQRYLADAQRAFRFISSKGWDAAGGGGMWWNTLHPYHSGPALASDTLLGTLLYNADHQAWQLEDVMTYVEWANANDTGDERQEYLEKPGESGSVIDYVQAPLIYAQFLLCQDGQGEALCTRAGRLAATLSEQNVNKEGYRYNYGPQYDSIFMQWMMAYGQASGDPYWLELAQLNAAAATKHAYDSRRLLLGSWWGGPIGDPETRPNMLRTDGATTSLFAWLQYYSNVEPA
ncbi:MAG: glycoside hydrolase family 76 protein [Solirubrobacteraceae bacterium]